MNVISVIGLGYVGLPLVVEFGRLGPTIGFDISQSKVDACARGADPSRELSDRQMALAIHAHYTTDPLRLAEADIIIVAVPTPVDIAHNPDFSPLIGASRLVGQHMKRGATVVYESTVYPGATEEVCIPELERASGLRWKQDFFVGYSPENTQRDLNIALMNELALIFDKIGIDTTDVLKAAGTKWNFLKFSPGLVGGHCIGVDPYYLTHKAGMLGYHPQVILAGRRINDGMAKFIAETTIKNMIAAGCHIKAAKVNVLGLTFKEDCGDLRNSKVADVITELESFGVEVFVHDPFADPEEALREYGVKLLSWDALPPADALVAAVSHRQLRNLSVAELESKLHPQGCFIDVKACFDRQALEAAGIRVWRL